MNAKYLIVGTIVGGAVVFLWGAVAHALLPAPIPIRAPDPGRDLPGLAFSGPMVSPECTGTAVALPSGCFRKT